jgi:hypothetical protein
LVLPLEVVPAVVAVAMEEGEPLGGHPTEGGGVLPVEEAMRVELAAVAMVTSAGCLTLAAFPRGVAETAVAMAAASEVFPASLVATAALLGTAPHSKAEASVAPPGPVAREEVFGCRVVAAPRVGVAAELSPTEDGAVGSLQTKPSSLPPLPLSLSPIFHLLLFLRFLLQFLGFAVAQSRGSISVPPKVSQPSRGCPHSREMYCCIR